MTTARELPGADAARNGTGEADLSVMLAAHAALRRDLVRLATAAAVTDLRDPVRLAAVQAGWETFKRQLHLHHTAEDDIVWPALRRRLGHSEQAQSVLDEMEDEHELIDPLMDVIDGEFSSFTAGIAGPAGLTEATEALAAPLVAHLAHEERDALPLIGVALTAGEWRSVGLRIARSSGLSLAGEMFAWLADSSDTVSGSTVSGSTVSGNPVPGRTGQATEATRLLPPPARLLYRAIWRPRYQRTPRW
jgi:iron-sulfur cluster repair protein YtfE (RIC family)